MKKIVWFFILLVTISLTSCFDVIETINLKEDGSGTYELKMDLSGAFEMLNSMKGLAGEKDSKSKSKKQFEKKDSSFTFEKEVMESTVLTEQEKAVFKNGKGQMKLDEEKGEGLITMNFPFKNQAEFNLIQKVMNSSKKKEVGFGKMGSLLGKESEELSPSNQNEEGGMVGDFITELSSNSFTRKVNTKNQKLDSNDKEEDLGEKEKLMMAQLMGMMEIKSTLVINFPTPIKHATGKNITVSDDKKRVEFSKKFQIDQKPTAIDFDMKIEF